MNTANLQLEGFYMAVASLVELMKQKGLVTAGEVDAALLRAESSAGGDRDLPPANLEAVGFPIRLLRLANATSFADHPLAFTELARRVGEEKSRRAVVSEEEMLQLATVIEQESDA